MRLLLISCLLIGSITCGPVGNGHGSATSFMQQQFPSGSWFGGPGWSSDPDSSSYVVDPANPSSEGDPEPPRPEEAVSSVEAGSDSSIEVDDGSDGSDADVEEEPSNVSQVREYGLPYGGYGDGGYGDDVRNSWKSGYEADPEPVFSDVSDLEPVYSFSSRSRYQRGKAVFAQTRYIPGEPIFYPMVRRTNGAFY